MSEQINQNQPVQEEVSLSELLQVRRDKLAELQEAGNDPFVITKFDVSHHGETIKENFEVIHHRTVLGVYRQIQRDGGLAVVNLKS